MTSPLGIQPIAMESEPTRDQCQSVAETQTAVQFERCFDFLFVYVMNRRG